MRPTTPDKLQKSIKDFLDGISVLPNWIISSSSDKPDRGHYEWGNWSDKMRYKNLWMLGGPWRTLAADVKKDGLISGISDFHKLKDQMVWEIVEQTYSRAETLRQSPASQETVKTRIRSVFSWQRRHDSKKHSLIWFIDFSFALLAYSEFQGRMVFYDPSISSVDIENMVPELLPVEFGKQVVLMENKMLHHNFIPFYFRDYRLNDYQILTVRRLARNFCVGLSPPSVDMDVEVRETRGMPREEKAIDFMTPWLISMEASEHESRWRSLIGMTAQYANVNNFEAFKYELCRVIISSLLIEASTSESPESGYVYDITAQTAVEQSEQELLVSLRLPGQKRKRTVSRRTLRQDLESRLYNWLFSSSSLTLPPIQFFDRGPSTSGNSFPQ